MGFARRRTVSIQYLWLTWEVAGSEVIRLLLLQGRNHTTANILSFPAAGMEIASTRWIDRTGHVAFEDDAFPFRFNGRIGDRNGRKQRLRVGMEGYIIELFTLSELRD